MTNREKGPAERGRRGEAQTWRSLSKPSQLPPWIISDVACTNPEMETGRIRKEIVGTVTVLTQSHSAIDAFAPAGLHFRILRPVQ